MANTTGVSSTTTTTTAAAAAESTSVSSSVSGVVVPSEQRVAVSSVTVSAGVVGVVVSSESAGGTNATDTEHPDGGQNFEEMLAEEVEDALEPLRMICPWVESPNDQQFSSHRKLVASFSILNQMDGVLKTVGIGDCKLHVKVVEAMYDYVKKAHEILLTYALTWIEENQGKPALSKVKTAIDTYRGTDKLDRYYRRALMNPDERSLASAVSARSSAVSKKQTSYLEEENSKNKEELLELKHQKEKIIQEKQEREHEMQKQLESANKQLESANKQLESANSQVKDVTTSADQLKKQLHDTTKKAMDERHKLEKKNLQLQKDLSEQKKVADRILFPDADDIHALNTMTSVVASQESSKQSGPSSTNRVNESLGMAAPASSKNILPLSSSSQPFQPANMSSAATNVKYFYPTKFPTSFPVPSNVSNQRPFVNTANPHPSAEYLRRVNPNNATDSFDDLLNYYLPPTTEHPSSTYLPTSVKKEEAKKPFSDSSPVPGMEWYKDPRSTKPELNSASTPGFSGQHNDGYLHARYTSAFEEMGRIQERRFTGIAHEYPIYRHKLVQKYSELATSSPDLLLKYIESTIGGEAYSYIRSAWYVKNPHEALKRIWDTLESIYGHPDGLIRDAMQEIKRHPKSVKRDRRSLLKFHADLEIFEGIALSVDQSSILDGRRMIGKIYESFSDELRMRFETRFPDPSEWTFRKVIEFLKMQIHQVQDCDFLLKSEEEEEWSRKDSVRKRHPERRNNPPRAAVVETENSGQMKPKETCVVHRDSSTHSTKNCSVFLAMTEQERHALIKEKKHCYICLGNHHRSNCESKSIKCDKCGKPHHTLLHFPTSRPSSSQNSSKETSNRASGRQNSSAKKSTQVVALGSTATHAENNPREFAVPIMRLTAVVKKDDGTILKRVPFTAFLDSGAEKSFATKELAMACGQWNPHRRQRVKVLGGDEIERPAMDMPLLLESRSGSIIHVYDVVFMDSKLPYAQNIPTSEVVNKYMHTRGHFPTDEIPQRIDMIVGAPLLREHGIFTNGKWIRGGRYEPLIGDHYLGAIWWGMKADATESPNMCTAQVVDKSLTRLQQNWAENQALESIISSKNELFDADFSPMSDIEDLKKRYYEDQLLVKVNCEDTTPSKQDQAILNFYNSSVKEVTDGGRRRLQLGLPWKNSRNTLENNVKVVEKRLLRQQARTTKKPELQEKYCATFDSMKNDGALELISDEQVQLESEDQTILVNYLDHFALEDAEKFRVVFNGKLRYKGVSLNDLLHRGPMFLPPLVAILLRFRQGKYAISGDIKSMFFQIKLDPKDRDCVRVLWFEGPGMSGNIKHYRFTVMPWGLTSIPSIAGFCIKHTTVLNYPDVSEKVCESLRNDVYVDDLLKSVDSIEEGKELIKGSVEVLGSTGFEMRKWLSNEPKILEDIDEDKLAPAIKDFRSEGDDLVLHKALGMTWNATSDSLQIKTINQDVDRSSLTQRIALSLLHSYYDPMGLWCPFLVRMKSYYHTKISRMKVGWDVSLPQQISDEYFKIMDEVNEAVQLINYPRPYSELPPERLYELHMFADASNDTVGACVYIRVMSYGACSSSLVYGKSRSLHESKVMKFSTARKELAALAMGAQCFDFCKNSLTLEFGKTQIWSDSTTVIQWCITQTKELKVFVRNRVDLILRLTNGTIPSYIRTKDNPADLATRGIPPQDSDSIQKWKFGPSFLQLHNSEWPDMGSVLGLPISEDGRAEMVSESSQVCAGQNVCANTTNHVSERFMIEEFKRCSTLHKAVKRVKIMLQCCLVWKSYKRNSDVVNEAPVTNKRCRDVLVKICQGHEMSNVIQIMKGGGSFEDAVSAIPKKERKS